MSNVNEAASQSAHEQALKSIQEKYGTGNRGSITVDNGVPKSYLFSPKNIRCLTSGWMDGPGMFVLTGVEQDKTNPDAIFEDFIFNALEGFVLHAEVQPSLSTKGVSSEEGNQLKVLCSATGHVDPTTRKLVKKIPMDGIKTMYKWDPVKGGYSNTQPHPIVETLGLVGSRGQSCKECIKAGNSVVQDENGSLVTCGPYGRLVMGVTHLIREKRDGTRTVKSVEDFLGSDNKIMLVSINLPGRIAVKGYYDRDPDKCRESYAPYVINLARNERSLSRDIRFIGTEIGIRPPVPGSNNTKNYLTFKANPHFDIDLLDLAHSMWNDLKVEQNLTHLDNPEVLDPAMFGLDEDFNPIKNKKAAANPTVKVESLEDMEEDNPFAED